MKTLQTRGSGYIALFYKSLHRKRDWRTSSLSFCLQALCCSRSDASGGVHSRDFPGLLGFSSLLMTGLFCELSHLSLAVCQGGCNNISQRQTKMCGSKVSLWKLFSHTSRFKFDLGTQLFLILRIISRNITNENRLF